MNKHYFTFGTHPEAVQVIEAITPDAARNRMIASFGSQWAFQYSELEWQQALSRGHFKNADYLPTIYLERRDDHGSCN